MDVKTTDGSRLLQQRPSTPIAAHNPENHEKAHSHYVNAQHSTVWLRVCVCVCHAEIAEKQLLYLVQLPAADRKVTK